MTENRAHRLARDRAMREGRDIYIVLDQNVLRVLPETAIPKNLEPLAGYHPSGNIIREESEE